MMLKGAGNTLRVAHDEQNQVCRTAYARMSPEDTFVSVCEVAWSHLSYSEATRLKIRSACRHGRQLHDRMCTSLVLDLSKTTKVPYADIRTTLNGMVQRGARFQTAVVMFNTEGSHSRQRRQLQTALGVCGGPHLTSLELRGLYDLTPQVTSVVASHCPGVTVLTIDCQTQGRESDDPSSDEEDEAGTREAGQEGEAWGGGPMEEAGAKVAEDGEEGAAAALLAGKAQAEGLDHWAEMVTLGLDRLLQQLGPRLQELNIIAADSWLPGMFRALRHCRELTDLFVEAGGTYAVGFDDQATILESVSQLPQLQDLHLELRCHAPDEPLSDVPARETRSFSHLSALTALTHLHLDYSYCTRDDHDWPRSRGVQVDERELWPAQRAALVAALRHMPHLVSFESITLSLRVSDLAALTSLTHVQLAGLESPGPTEQQQPAAMGAGTVARGPHQLQQLHVALQSCSLRALACLGAFPLLRYARTGVLCFGPADLSPGGTQLLPDTPQVVRQAVRALADVRARGRVDGEGRHAWDREDSTLVITTGAGPGLLLPPAPAPLAASPAGGHAVWLRELGPLGVQGQGVQLRGLALTAGDLAAIADTFPDAKSLDLRHSRVQLAALPCLGHMRQLQRLTVDLRQGGAGSKEVLSAALFATCFWCRRLQKLEVVCVLQGWRGCVRRWSG